MYDSQTRLHHYEKNIIEMLYFTLVVTYHCYAYIMQVPGLGLYLIKQLLDNNHY